MTRRIANQRQPLDTFGYDFLGDMLTNRGANKDWVRVLLSKQLPMTVYLAERRYVIVPLFQALSVVYLKITVPLLAPTA